MNFEKYLDVINACRFCFMCRHLAPVGNVTFKEADTPRGRALIADKVRMDKENLKNPDFIKTMYEAELSAANRYHCVSHYDETGLVLELRKDIVEAGFAPANVQELASELQSAEFTVSGEGDVLFYAGLYGEASDCGKAIAGGDCGKALEVLGYVKESEAVLAKFKAAVTESGCKTLVTSCPASYDMLKNKLNGVEVMHSSQFLLDKASPQGSKKACYLESDYLKNYNDDISAPRELLAKLGYELVPFGTNPEESYTIGEGAVVYDKVNPELAKRMCDYVVDLMDSPDDLLITASPYTKAVMQKFCPDVKVITLDEAAVGEK